MSIGRVVLDLETQRDFFHPEGTCYRPDSLAVAWRICRLFGWVRSERITVISTVLRLPHGEVGPMSADPHCITDSKGERKLLPTVLDRRINFGLRNVAHLPNGVLDDYQQLIFEKRHTDIFHHARIERLITEIGPTEVIICGAGLGQGIVEAAIGLQARRFDVIIAKDAVLDLDAPNQYMPIERMRAKGCLFHSTEDIIAATATSPISADDDHHHLDQGAA
jgi:nicotinamidase-related amidase